MPEKEQTGNVVKSSDFKSKDDWINQILDKHGCTVVEGKKEEKDKDGKVTQRATKDKKTVDPVKVCALADENFITHKGPEGYVNPGMCRMSIGNSLRAAAKKRHGLNVLGKWKKAPDDFPVNEEKTQKPDGSAIANKKVKEDA